MVSSLGIGSGLPLSNLIDSLVSAEGANQSARIRRNDERMQVEVSALGDVKGVLSDFQSLIRDKLLKPASFQLRSASSSDSSTVSISASTSAAAGNHTIEVTNLATSHKVATGVFSLPSDAIGTGQITIQYGTYSGGSFSINPDKGATAVTINAEDNSLTGIRDAINSAGGDVQASIVNDGAGYRLVLSSNDTGAENSLKIIIDDDDTTDTNTSGLSQLAFDPAALVGSGKNLTETVAAADASIIFDGLSINKSDNVITDIIDGATITLHAADPGVVKNLAIAIDKTTIKNNIQAFLNSFKNVYNNTIKTLTSYSAETGEKGDLLGDFTLRTLDAQVRKILTSRVDNLFGPFQSLVDIGITTNAGGELVLNDAKISSALDNNLEEIARLFTAYAKSEDANINYVSSSEGTKVGSYFLNVTQVATRGDLVGSAVANTTITSGVNDAITVDLDGRSATVVLTAGTYTADELAAMVQSSINGSSVFASNGLSVNVSQAAGVLALTSNSYGSNSTVDITGGNGLTDLVGGAATVTTGLDVAGTLNGVAATGSGQLLSGVGDAAGLVLEITGGAIGDRGYVEYTNGVGVQLDNLLEQYLDAEGPLNSRISSLNDNIAKLDDEREVLTIRLQAFQQRLVNQFTAMDSLLSQLNSTGSFLSQQFNLLANIYNQ